MAWLPDGRLLVAYSDTVRILLNTYDPNHLPEEVGYFDPPRSADWTKTSAIAVSPDGRTLALGVVRDDQIGDITYGLLTMPLEGANLNHPGELSFSFRNDLPGALMNDSLHWLPGGRLAYILRYPAGSPVKAKVFAIHPQGNASPEQLASFSDPLLASAWSADGRWLTAITGAGRYVLDLSLAPGVSPAWVDGETGLDVDW
jgi:Tol biopolymer transport system component